MSDSKTVDIDSTLGGRIEWRIMPSSPYTDAIKTKLDRLFESIPDLTADEKALISDYSALLSLTEDIIFKFDGREKRLLTEFASGWGRREKMSARQLFDFLMRLSYVIRSAWFAACYAEQVPFEVDPAQMPTEALTDEQKAEAADPASPLPPNAATSANRSST